MRGRIAPNDFLQAAHSGNLKTVQCYVLENDHDSKALNVTDSKGNTALILSTRQNHFPVVEFLLSNQHILIDAANVLGDTALIWSANNGNFRIVKRLVEKGANVNHANHHGHTALFAAAGRGYQEIVNYLIQVPNVDLSLEDESGCSVLSMSAYHGRIEALKSLFAARTSNIATKQDNLTLRFLLKKSYYSLGKSYIEVIRLFLNIPNIEPVNLARLIAHIEGNMDVNIHVLQLVIDMPGFNVNERDADGNTALIWAVRKNYRHLVPLLLKKDGIDTNIVNDNGDSALGLAAKKGDEAVVNQLIRIKKTNVNTANIFKRTPLMLAAKKGHVETVKILYHAADININATNECGENAYLLAVKNGCIEVVHFFHEVKSSSINAANVGKENDCLLAAKYGHEKVLRFLISTKKEEAVRAISSFGDNIFLLSVKYGHLSIVAYLYKMLPRKMFFDRHGRNAFLLAIEYKQDGVAKFLYHHFTADEIESHREDAMLLAARGGYIDMLNSLLASGGVISEKLIDKCFLAAVEKNHLAVIKRIMEEKTIDSVTLNQAYLLAAKRKSIEVFYFLFSLPGVDRNVTDDKGKSILHLAAESDSLELVRFLCDAWQRNLPEQFFFKVNILGETALMLAAENGCSEVLSALLPLYKDRINQVNNEGNTALMMAAMSGMAEIIQLLLTVTNMNIDIDIVNNDGLNALMLAVRGGNEEAVRVLLAHRHINANAVFRSQSEFLGLLMPSTTIRLKKRGVEGIKSISSIAKSCTALTWAAVEGQIDIIPLLLDVPKIAINVSSKESALVIMDAILQWLYSVNVDELSVNALNNLKPFKEELFDIILKKPFDDQLFLIRKIIERKDETALGKLFWFGNTSISRGRLKKVFTKYQELMRSELIRMYERQLTQEDIELIFYLIIHNIQLPKNDMADQVILKWLENITVSDLSPPVLDYLKALKSQLLCVIVAFPDKDHSLYFLKKIFDDDAADKKNDSTVLGKVFWAGNPSIHGGRLGMAYRCYMNLKSSSSLLPSATTFFCKMIPFAKGKPERKVSLGRDISPEENNRMETALIHHNRL